MEDFPVLYPVLYVATSIIGWFVPIVLMVVSFFASVIMVGAVVSVLDGLMNPQAGIGKVPNQQ